MGYSIGEMQGKINVVIWLKQQKQNSLLYAKLSYSCNLAKKCLPQKIIMK